MQNNQFILSKVEAYVASWIEIFGCRLKMLSSNVEAYVASWIEINRGRICTEYESVEAYVASWIEMSYVFGRWDRRISRGLRSLVD